MDEQKRDAILELMKRKWEKMDRLWLNLASTDKAAAGGSSHQ